MTDSPAVAAYWADMYDWAHDLGKYSKHSVVTVELTPEEYEEAVTIALQRHVGAKDRKAVNAMEYSDSQRNNILGALAEKAYAKGRHVPWDSPFLTGNLRMEDGSKRPDFVVREKGKKVALDVRAETPRLLLNKGDDPASWIYLQAAVKLGERTVRFLGWIRGRDGMKPEFWDATLPRPCYAVPTNRLEDVADLPKP